MRKVMPLASVFVIGLLGLSMPTWAVDGIVLIDQNKAMAGNVTPGDTPGFPVTISQPGSYRLASNLTAPQNSGVILITASGVDLDLNGFLVTCTGDSSPNRNGVFCITSSFGTRNISVYNGKLKALVPGGLGTIENPVFCVDGISLGGSSRVQLHDLIAEADFCNGIAGTGAYAIVRHNISDGFNVDCPSLVIQNINTSPNSGSTGQGCIKVENLGGFSAVN